MNQKTAKTGPEYFAEALHALRGFPSHLPPGAAGPAKPSRVENLVNYLRPALDASEAARNDYKVLENALNKAVPGLGRSLTGKIRRGAHGVVDYAGGVARSKIDEHGPAIVDRVMGLVRKAKEPTPWYADPITAGGVGLGAAGLLGAGGLMLHRSLANKSPDAHPLAQGGGAETDAMNEPNSSMLGKISSALDLIADEIDARTFMPPQQEEKVASEEPADVFGQFYEFYKQQVGEEPPAALVEKLAQDADEETLSALEKLVKRAGLERPNPLGEPSEGGGYREPPSTRNDAMKMAWEQFEETLLNYESA